MSISQPNDPSGVPNQQQDTGSTIDLDQFLNVLPPGGQNNSAISTSYVVMPETDRVALVGILVDDSGSMSGLDKSVIEGLNLSVEAFQGAKGSDFYLDVRGFKGPLYKGMLRDVKGDSFNTYVPSYGFTPLISCSLSQLKELRIKAGQYSALGIPATVALLLLTDGAPNGEEEKPGDFSCQIQAGDYIVGMGIADPSHEGAQARYVSLFSEMGVSKIVTPRNSAAEIRHAINQFSQSVASIAAA